MKAPCLALARYPDYTACGHHRNGVLLAAISAELLTGQILNTPLSRSDLDLLEAFSWERFASPTTRV